MNGNNDGDLILEPAPDFIDRNEGEGDENAKLRANKSTAAQYYYRQHYLSIIQVSNH